MSLDLQLQSAFTAVGNAVKTKISASEKGAANGVATLDATGKIPASQIPGSIDEIVEFSNFATLPVTGTASIIYVTLDNNKTYRWSGSSYIEISPSDVSSVNGMTGAVSITTITGNAGTATKLANVVNIGGVGFDGSANINLPGVNATGNQNTTGTAGGLTTAVTINGVSFNGKANIELEDRLGVVASTSTTTVGTAGLGNVIRITGTASISSLGVASSIGVRRTLLFDGALTLVHNATSLICPDGANISTVAGTVVEVVAETTNNWRILSITHPNVSFTELGYLNGVSSSIQQQINFKADLASPTFTGTPTLPTGTIATTQVAGNNTTAVATTAFVSNAVTVFSNSIGSTNTDYVAVFNASLL